MSDPIISILNDYARCWHDACVSWEPEFRDVNEVAKQIRQQIGRELLGYETMASFDTDKTYYDGCKEWEYIIREICQLENES